MQCNGSTEDSESFGLGSSPSILTKFNAFIAQLVECYLGKIEVVSSILAEGTTVLIIFKELVMSKIEKQKSKMKERIEALEQELKMSLQKKSGWKSNCRRAC